MKISTKGRYALRMLLDLAQHQNDGYVALKDIARRQNVSKKYLEQIVPMLNKSDILLASRGFQGGYRLAQSPDKYTVGMILRITEAVSRPSRVSITTRSVRPQCRLHHAARVAGTQPRHQRISRQHHPAGYIRSAAGGFRQRLQHLNIDEIKSSPETNSRELLSYNAIIFACGRWCIRRRGGSTGNFESGHR